MRTLLVMTLVWGSTAAADEPKAAVPPGWDVAAEGQLGLQLQRLGAMADLKLRARRGLYASDSEFLSTNFFSAGLSAQVAPVFANVGVQVDLQPASFFKLSGGYHFVGYSGVFGSLRSPTDCGGLGGVARTDARCDYHPITFEAEPPGVPATGHRLWGEATLMGRLGDVIIVGAGRLDAWLMNAPGEFWVNELSGLPQARTDATFSGGGAVLYALLNPDGRKPELLVGVANDLGLALGTGALFNRVGPVAVLRAPKWGAWRDASVSVAVLFYTHERYLAGWPYLAAAFSIATPNFLGRPAGSP